MAQQHLQVITDWLAAHERDIHRGRIRVLALDECHVQAGDICGYGWGHRQQRREVEVDNYRQSQTYFGALDCVSGEVILRSSQGANSDTTIDFIEQLQAHSGDAQLVLVWDGASYHRSQQIRDFLARVNQGTDWRVHCLRLPPYAPRDNPIENIWGQAKHLLRQMHQRCRSFKLTRKLFEWFIDSRFFTLPNLSSYEAFSGLI